VRACQLAVFSDKLPSMEADIDASCSLIFVRRTPAMSWNFTDPSPNLRLQDIFPLISPHRAMVWTISVAVAPGSKTTNA
jgi:hypothetical protein